MNMNKKSNKSNTKKLTVEETQKFIDKYNKDVIQLIFNIATPNSSHKNIQEVTDYHQIEKEVADEK
jgi:L-cysteine desulfidase